MTWSAVVQIVIDAFNNRMQVLSDEYDNAVFIDARGTVRKSQWYDEIHPDSYGFQQVALKFIAEINRSVAEGRPR